MINIYYRDDNGKVMFSPETVILRGVDQSYNTVYTLTTLDK